MEDVALRRKANLQHIVDPLSIDLEEDDNLPIVSFSDDSGSMCNEVEGILCPKGVRNNEQSVFLILRIVDENGERFGSAPVTYPIVSFFET